MVTRPALPTCSIVKYLVVLLGAASCVPKSAADQAKHANDNYMGSLDGALQPVGKHGEHAQSAQDGAGMSFTGATGGRMCIQQEGGDRIWYSATAESITSGRQRYVAKTHVAVGAYDSLDGFGNGPDPSSGIAGTVASTKTKEHFRENNVPGTGSMWLDYVLEWCAPMPAITASTRYITATKWAPDHEHPAVFIWQIKGTPTPVAGATPATPPAAPTETTSAPIAPAKSVDGTALDLLRKERFDKLLELATAAGKDQDLAKGNLIVIAPYDNSFPNGRFDAVLADKARAAAVFDDLVIDGTLTKEDLVAKKSVAFTTRSGRKVVFGFDEKSKRPLLDGEKLERKIYEGSGWIVFTTFKVSLP